MAKKRVTITQVAERAGTSVTAVSLVLNKRQGSRISAATARRIEQAASDLNYRADPTAKSLRTRSSRTIGFISDEVTITRFASELIRGCLDVADRTDHLVLINECPFDGRPLGDVIEALYDRRVDAIVFALMRSRHVTIPDLPRQTNGVIVNGTATVLSPDEDPWQLPSVLPDEYVAGRTAINRLLKAGHRRIALIGRAPEHLDPSVSVTIGDRLRGLDDRLAEEGLTFIDEVPTALWEPASGYTCALELLERNATRPAGERITAVVSANDRLAFGVYQAAQERGISIPHDLSVISFDNEDLATYLRPGLTTVELPHLTMGTIATSLILEPRTLRSHKNQGNALLVDMPLIERESVAPPAQA